MAITKDQLDSFHRFAAGRLDSGAVDLELDELLSEWYDAHDRKSVNAIVAQGLSDIELGQGRCAREVTEELRSRHDLSAK